MGDHASFQDHIGDLGLVEDLSLLIILSSVESKGGLVAIAIRSLSASERLDSTVVSALQELPGSKHRDHRETTTKPYKKNIKLSQGSWRFGMVRFVKMITTHEILNGFSAGRT